MAVDYDPVDKGNDIVVTTDVDEVDLAETFAQNRGGATRRVRQRLPAQSIWIWWSHADSVSLVEVGSRRIEPAGIGGSFEVRGIDPMRGPSPTGGGGGRAQRTEFLILENYRGPACGGFSCCV
jgi:hypothetical protein